MTSQFRLLLLLDDDYGGIENSYFDELCQNLCSKLGINTWEAASNIEQLIDQYENLDSKPMPEEILLISDVLDTHRNSRLDEEVIRKAYQKGWGKKATILFFSREQPKYLPSKTCWMRQSKSGFPRKDADLIRKIIQGQQSADRSDEDNWDDIGRKLATPWRFEYFLELSLKLALGNFKSNNMKVANDILNEIKKRYHIDVNVVSDIKQTLNQCLKKVSKKDIYDCLEELIKEEIFQYFKLDLSEKIMRSD